MKRRQAQIPYAKYHELTKNFNPAFLDTDEWGQLILTYETELDVLSTKTMRALVNKYLS